MSKRHQFIINRFDDALRKSAATELREAKRKKDAINEIVLLLYGATGEEKVVQVLQTLPDDHILINDFNLTFQPAMINRQEGDAIRSIQIDHLLIAPSGVYIIETKNWSEDSLHNLDLRSPVAQIARSGYAVFRLLVEAVRKRDIALRSHHWGDRKIPVRKLIVFMRRKPSEVFPFVNILTIDQLRSYISRANPVFSTNEIKAMGDYFLRLSRSNRSYSFYNVITRRGKRWLKRFIRF